MMTVYRITLEKFSDNLYASGNAARWNSKDVKMIYTAGSRALACLENVVHRSSRGLQGQFRTLVIDIPGSLKVLMIRKTDLPSNWQEYAFLSVTQQLGDAWIARNDSAVLRVPSAIIPEEYNFLLNPAHKDFRKVRLTATEPFSFDERIKRGL